MTGGGKCIPGLSVVFMMIHAGFYKVIHLLRNRSELFNRTVNFQNFSDYSILMPASTFAA